MLALTFRTWIRYIVPLTLIAAVTMCLVGYTAYSVAPATDIPTARAQLHLGWFMAATAWIFQLLLVAAAAPMVRTSLSQPAALIAGARQLVRALVPIGVAVAAIMLGFVALVVPGLLLLGLLCLTGASERLGEGLPAALEDSVAVVRANAKQVAIAIAVIVAADLALALAAHLILLPALPKKPTPAMMLPARTFVRVVALALIALSSLPACALATIYNRQRAS